MVPSKSETRTRRSRGMGNADAIRSPHRPVHEDGWPPWLFYRAKPPPSPILPRAIPLDRILAAAMVPPACDDRAGTKLFSSPETQNEAVLNRRSDAGLCN